MRQTSFPDQGSTGVGLTCGSNSSVCTLKTWGWGDSPAGSEDKNLPVSAGDMGSTPGPRRSHMPGSN